MHPASSTDLPTSRALKVHATARRLIQYVGTVRRGYQSHAYQSQASQKWDPSRPFEEERLPWYAPDDFYPVHIGEVFASRYKVVGKLGYGAQSTVWLCRDMKERCFATLKVGTREDVQGTSLERELQFYSHVSAIHSKHPGQAYIRGLFETFRVKGPVGQHLCLVHQPMHMTIQELQYQNVSHRLSEQILKWTLVNVLTALSFLHDEANVVHTDINPSNVMLTVADESMLVRFERRQSDDPAPVKVINNVRSIYGSRKLGLPENALWGQPVLCDFGEARIGQLHEGLIQPEIYRAPEVLFEMEWSSAVDMWNVAVLMWDLFENQHLFYALDESGESSGTHHIAEMVGYIGLPPSEYVQRSEVTKKVFDEEGRWTRAGGVDVPQCSLEEAEKFLRGKDKDEFLNFLRSMLKWLPEERITATKLLDHPWLQKANIKVLSEY